ncbi:MAG TPA: hypothetical protein VLG46_04480 [Anaerolineae bacterium]|nr:hypothetical protein [Anaerolineae bacterium]
MRKQYIPIIGIAVLLAALGIYGLLSRASTTSFTVQQSLAKFTEKDVAVEVTVEKDQTGQIWLAGTFTPTKPKFHLYSKDLPRTGISGVGRPTLLEVLAPADLRPTGSLQANQPVQDLYLDVLQQTFPVYPDGPVTVRLPIEKPARATMPIELAVTYMACSDTTCLAPVENKRIAATLRSP